MTDPHASKGPQTKLTRIGKRFRPLQLIGLLGLTSIIGFTSGAALALVLSMKLLKHHSSAHLPHSLESLGNLPVNLDHPINILILGIDNSGHPHSGSFKPSEALSGNSDTMLLVRLVPATHQINVLSIPRDTQVQLPGVGTDKINDANVRGGVTLAAQSVSQVAAGAQIDRYIRLDIESFIHLVDALGGVEVNVPRAMDYVDHTQKLSIHFSPGKQKLNGQHLEEYIRFRHDEWGDIGRVQRQQDVMKAILRELLKPATVTKAPQLMQVAQTDLDTDLSVGEMVAILRFVVASNSHRTNFVMLPGRFSRPEEYTLSYWIQDTRATVALLSKYFDITPTDTTASASQSPLPTQLKIAVASRQPGIAEKMVDHLERLGFTNVYTTDHEIDSSVESDQETQVIAQTGNADVAEQVKRAIGVGQVQVSSVGDLSSDVTIVVGSDFVTTLNRQ
jgi:LCP family protein required for cell wall assembly